MISKHICTRCLTVRIRGELDGQPCTTYIPYYKDGRRICLHRWAPVSEGLSLSQVRPLVKAHRDSRKLNALDRTILYSLIAGTVLALVFNLTGA